MKWMDIHERRGRRPPYIVVQVELGLLHVILYKKTLSPRDEVA